MKTLLKLAATALLTWTTVAPALAAPPANLNISSERGQPFSLVLDGRPLTRPVARQVHVDLLMPGRHWADFSVPTAYGPPLRFRTEVWLAPGLETSYVLVMRPYGPQLRQVGAVALGQPGYGPGGWGGGYPAQPGGGYGSQGGYYDNGQNAPTGGPGNYPGGGQYGNGQDNPDDYGYTPAPGQPGGSPGGYPTPGGGYYPGSTTSTNLRPLSPAEATNLTQALRQRPFDDERLSIAKQALGQSSVRADDLTDLLKTLSFDKSRIELAKFGYAHVADPQNFYRVYSALQFSSSVREVQEAVGVPTR